jgi:hypothetical protein
MLFSFRCGQLLAFGREDADANAVALQRHDRALFEMDLVARQGLPHELEVVLRTYLRHPHLDHAWSAAPLHRERGGKVEIAGQNDCVIREGPTHDLGVVCILRADLDPMDRFDARGAERRHPISRQVHVDHQLHSAAASSTSR